MLLSFSGGISFSMFSSKSGLLLIMVVVKQFSTANLSLEHWIHLVVIFLNGKNLITTPNNHKCSQTITFTAEEKSLSLRFSNDEKKETSGLVLGRKEKILCHFTFGRAGLSNKLRVWISKPPESEEHKNKCLF